MLIHAYSTRRTWLPVSFASDVAGRQLWPDTGRDEQFAAHLAEFIDYVRQGADRQETPQLDALVRHIHDVQRHYVFTIDETNPNVMAQLGSWALEANAVIFAQWGDVLDPNGLSLLGSSGQPAAGSVPLRPEALQRAQRWRRFLAENQQINVADQLAPVRSGDEIVTQTALDVGLRIIGLALVADFASAVVNHRQVNPDDMRAVYPQSFAALTPTEQRLMAGADPNLAMQLMWRLEAVKELLWASGRGYLDWPQSPCQADRVLAGVFDHREDDFLATTQLRDLNELIDEQERTRDILWALREHEQNGGSEVAGTDADVVNERMTAINWLLRRGAAWDDVENLD